MPVCCSPSVASFSSVGAIDQAADERQVAKVRLEPDGVRSTGALRVDPGTKVRITLEARVRLSEAAIASVGSEGAILSLSAPMNVEISDAGGEPLHLEAGDVAGTVIVPREDSPHRDGFDPAVELSWVGQGFEAPDDGRIEVEVAVPALDDADNRIESASVVIADRVPRSAGRWVAGGFAFMLVGPLIAMLGLILFLVGLAMRSGKKRGVPTPATSPPAAT